VDDSRWVEVSPSQFAHEAEGLRLVKELLPNVDPFRAWSNFEFRDTHGRWHEVDLAVLGRDTLYLVELKYYSGRLRGDDHRWLRDGNRAEDSPLKLAHRKAQYFASLLKERLRQYLHSKGQHNVDLRSYIPYVQEAVFIHHPNMRCEMPPNIKQGIYGLEGREGSTGLKPISQLLLAPARHKPIDVNQSSVFAALMKQIGLVPRRQREVGSWVIDDQPLGDGEGWQDWPAFHRVTTTDRYRIRFYVPRPGGSRDDERALERQVEREYQLLSRLSHDGVLAPRDIVKAELGTGLVYPAYERLKRLDLWFAEQPDGLSLKQQLEIIRKIAEALNYAHRHRVVHRGLAPSAVAVRHRSDGGFAVVVNNWESAGTVPAAATSSSHVPVSSGGESGVALADFGDEDELFEAPEGKWAVGADRIRLDVFALGALAFYVLMNQGLPAQDRGELVKRIRRDGGLDVAAELPQVPSKVRQLVLDATNPRPSKRTASVAEFLAELDKAEEALYQPTLVEEVDPLDAGPGALLGGRYKFLRRLGSGSTAIGLLVSDELAGSKHRVLKVAKDDSSAARLAAEEKALGALDHDRIVDCIDSKHIGNRKVLVLSYAGETTLAEELARKRARLSLDVLERWGTDLLSALVELDRAGIFHRDIKPSNLGVKTPERKRGGTIESRTVLFDFSMSGTDPRALAAGTPHYRDPFLGQGGRQTYDSAAERYGAAVVLYEMATGSLPEYGSDPDADPASIPDDVSLNSAAFDPAVREDLESFFRTALSREADRRYDTADDMRRAWVSIFERLGRSGVVDKSTVVTLDSPLSEAGMSARAVSALESDASAVADLIALDSTLLNRLVAKEAKETGAEIRTRRKEWHKAFSDELKARQGQDYGRPAPGGVTLPDPLSAADLLVQIARGKRAETRQHAAELILGVREGLDAFASQQELAQAVGRSGPRGFQLIKELQNAWAEHHQCRELLEQLVRLVTRSLKMLGGVATVRTLTQEILAALPDTPPDQSEKANRVAAGLLRLTLDRYMEHEQAETQEPLAKRRRAGRLALIATDAALLDAADAIAQVASKLLDTAAQEGIVPQQRAAREVRTVFDEAFREASGGMDAPAMSDLRLVRLAAQATPDVGLSARGELHSLRLPRHVAVRLALSGVGHQETLGAKEVVARVRARFPDLDPLPGRPALDEIVEKSGLGLRFVDGEYRPEQRASSATSGLPSRPATVIPETSEAALSRGDHMDRVLSESLRTRSFLALGVGVLRSDEVERAVATLSRRFDARTVDITGLMIGEMKATAEEVGLPWDLVRSADAAAPGTRDARGLQALVERVVPRVTAHIDDLVLGGATSEPDRPVILTELSPLARYGHLGLVARWSDLAAKRSRPVWVLLPQMSWMRGAIVDGKPLQLGSNGQFVELDTAWLTTQEERLSVSE
jgi:serine/threonine protein kinase